MYQVNLQDHLIKPDDPNKKRSTLSAPFNLACVTSLEQVWK